MHAVERFRKTELKAGEAVIGLFRFVDDINSFLPFNCIRDACAEGQGDKFI